MYKYRINVARMHVGFGTPRPTYRHFFRVELGGNGNPVPTRSEALAVFDELEARFPKHEGYSITMSKQPLVSYDVSREELLEDA